ncbi:hypothetical protein [Streptomyces sp. NPDC059256]|uniref:hypothetical protein n=1 Tax=Streptomyces sp. NPDC059256 TaxID=3346794 RepID=UPI0036AF9DBB
MSGKKVANTPQLGVGELVFDITQKALGVVMDTGADMEEDRYSLRPPGGGIEWTAVRADLRPASVVDRIRPALTEVNERSSRQEGSA